MKTVINYTIDTGIFVKFKDLDRDLRLKLCKFYYFVEKKSFSEKPQTTRNRINGVLTKAELQLAQAGDSERGRDLIKEVRIQLLEKGRPLLEAVINDITGSHVVSMHTDISTITGERIILFTLDQPPQMAPRL